MTRQPEAKTSAMWPETEWRCPTCKTLLGDFTDMGLKIRTGKGKRKNTFMIEGKVTGYCAYCGDITRITAEPLMRPTDAE